MIVTGRTARLNRNVGNFVIIARKNFHFLSPPAGRDNDSFENHALALAVGPNFTQSSLRSLL